MIKRVITIAIFLFYAASSSTSHAQEKSLINPNPEMIAMLYERINSHTPEYEKLAVFSDKVKKANEFKKEAETKEEITRLKSLHDATKDIHSVIIDLNSEFGQYDDKYGEYIFDISDGTYILYNVFGTHYAIMFTNATDAQTWKLSAKEAEQVLRKNEWRTVRLSLVLEPINTLETMLSVQNIRQYDIPTKQLNMRIKSYIIYKQNSNEKLGSVNLEEEKRN